MTFSLTPLPLEVIKSFNQMAPNRRAPKCRIPKILFADSWHTLTNVSQFTNTLPQTLHNDENQTTWTLMHRHIKNVDNEHNLLHDNQKASTCNP